MLQKKYVIPILFMVMIILSTSCTVVDDRPRVEPPPPKLPTFTPVGSTWEMVSINGKSVVDYFVPLSGEYTDTKTKIVQNDFIFSKNGSWFWTLDLEITAKLGGGVALLPEVTLAGQGTFELSGMNIILILQKMDAQLEPPDFWASAGVSEEAFAKQVISGRLIGKVETWMMNISGDTLTLTRTDGQLTQVLRKK